MYVPPTEITSRKAFIPNQFSYAVPVGCLHYVLWYAAAGDTPPTDAQISADIAAGIRLELGLLRISHETGRFPHFPTRLQVFR